MPACNWLNQRPAMLKREGLDLNSRHPASPTRPPERPTTALAGAAWTEPPGAWGAVGSTSLWVAYQRWRLHSAAGLVRCRCPRFVSWPAAGNHPAPRLLLPSDGRS
jgi:hypothetical protein